ncbi:MAG: enoyl-CoA hydratase/isomerase family protein [Chloroflexi bacterium]|nr:MAG: enoyl-CoA hydratase/isomerase family protein [Chloroflexota bacterium]
MVASGKSTFYQRDENGLVVGYYSPQTGDYVPLERDPREITIAELRAKGAEVAGNDDASVYDMGDGVLLWEFHSKQNTITPGLVEIGWEAVRLLEDNDDYVALVIGNDGERFSIGAGLDPSALMSGVEGIEQMVKNLQDLTMALKYASKPVVVAVHNMALGGGCELVMAGNFVVAHIESYIGLVEIGVGLVPAGGGMKELVRRLVNPLAQRGADVLPALEKILQTVATATVSESAKIAQEIGFLSSNDKIVMNRAHLLGEAKKAALGLAAIYTPQEPELVYASGRDAHAALLLGIQGFVEGNYATEHDAYIARHLANIMTGGALSEPQWAPQQLFLDLEREAFVDLIQQPKTQERIMYMLQNNKPLRN